MLLDTDEDRMDSEEPTLYHVLKMKKTHSKNNPKGAGPPWPHK